MLIHKIEKTHFSESETIILNYIFSQGDEIRHMTISQIASSTYTSPPLLVRIAKKLGYNGWNAFKEDYLKELEYLNVNREVDASVPFTENDSIMNIAHHIVQLEKETLDDTMSLMKHDDLQKVIQIIRNSKEIDIYGVSNQVSLAQTFKHNMSLINKKVNIYNSFDNAHLHTLMSNEHKSAIIISYSGRIKYILDIAKKLKEKQTPLIVITSIADTELTKIADVTLRMSSREFLYNKIGDYSTTQSIKCILDILYSCIFSLEYDKNLEYKIKVSKELNDDLKDL